ncbi:MAG TPA: DUF4157 domain-containing protein, partial [Thermoanaerobaculia bacterium]|nr:DUF4157 domain-containing protein [Thermoanaerobaculia bacterium]
MDAGPPSSAGWAGIPLFLQRAAEPGAAEELPEAEEPAEEPDGAESETPSEDAAGDGAVPGDSGEGAPPPDAGEAGAQEQGDLGDAGGDAGGDGADGGAYVQMKCACGGTCESCRAASNPGPPESESEHSVVQREALPGDDAPLIPPKRLLQELSGGTPLPPAVAARFAATFGRNFDHVRIHEATAAAPALRARAFTIGHHVAFAPGEFRPGTPSGDRLIAHELTHVVQQSGGRGTMQGAGLSRGGYEAEADRAAETAVRGGRVRAVTAVRRKAVQRASVAEFLEEKAWGFVRDHFPDLEPYLRNPGRIWTSIVDTVGEGVGNLVNRALGAIRSFHPLDALKGLFGPLITAAATAFKTKDCGPFFAAVNQFRAKISAFTAGPLGVLKRKFAAIKKTVRGMIRKVTAPIGKLLRKVGGAIYKGIRATATRISGLIQKAKDWSARAWTWVKEKLGLNDESSSEGIWAWVKRKAGEAWEKAKPRLLPWLGPLKTVATVLLVLSPFGPIVLAIKFGPKIVNWLTSIYDQLHVPERITAARAAIARSMPAIVRGLARGAFMLTGIPLAIAGLHRAATVLHSLGNALSGVSLLGFAGDAVKFVATKIEEGVTWVGGPVKSAIHGIEEGLKHAGAWLDKIGQGAAKLISIVVNPFGIVGFLAGELWLAIPTCFKLPILNWILDLLIKLVRAIPVNPLLGPMFPLFLHAVVGFLQRVRGGDDSDEKVRV